MTVSIDLLDPDPVYQAASKEKLTDLALKISTTGLLEPISVRKSNGRYFIVVGNVNYLAAKLAGFTEVEIQEIPKSVEDVFCLASGRDHEQRLTDIEQYITISLLNLRGPVSQKHISPFYSVFL